MKRLLAPTLVLCLVATGASCGSDDERSDPPTPSTTSPGTTEPDLSDEDEIADLATRWHTASKRIYRRQADVSRAEDFLTGDYLEAYEDQATEFLWSDNATRPDDRSSQEVEALEFENDTTVILTECVVDADVLLDGQTDAVINDDVIAKRYRSVVEETDDGWRYAARETLSENLGATTCASE